jgi:hypothetical protein
MLSFGHDLRANAFPVCREGKQVPTPRSKREARCFRIMLLRRAVSHYRAASGNSTSSVTYQPSRAALAASRMVAKALTLQHPASIRAAIAAGAIPPPLFFERRRHFWRLALATAFSKTRPVKPTASITRLKRRLALTEI